MRKRAQGRLRNTALTFGEAAAVTSGETIVTHNDGGGSTAVPLSITNGGAASSIAINMSTGALALGGMPCGTIRGRHWAWPLSGTCTSAQRHLARP